MSGAIEVFTDQNWQAEVLESKAPVLVDFWAEWCAPCRMVAPTLEEIATTYAGTVKVGKLDVDSHGEVAARYSVRGIPTILLFANGEVQDQIVGAGSKDNLVRMIEKVVPPVV